MICHPKMRTLPSMTELTRDDTAQKRAKEAKQLIDRMRSEKYLTDPELCRFLEVAPKILDGWASGAKAPFPQALERLRHFALGVGIGEVAQSSSSSSGASPKVAAQTLRLQEAQALLAGLEEKTGKDDRAVRVAIEHLTGLSERSTYRWHRGDSVPREEQLELLRKYAATKGVLWPVKAGSTSRKSTAP